MSKLAVRRWQYDEIENILSATMSDEDAEKLVAEHFELAQIPARFPEVPIVYVFFGYKQDAVHWRLENDVAMKDVVLARDWRKLEGRRGRPKPIYGNREWFRNNRNHEIVKEARQQIYNLEVIYGMVADD